MAFVLFQLCNSLKLLCKFWNQNRTNCMAYRLKEFFFLWYSNKMKFIGLCLPMRGNAVIFISLLIPLKNYFEDNLLSLKNAGYHYIKFVFLLLYFFNFFYDFAWLIWTTRTHHKIKLLKNIIYKDNCIFSVNKNN